MIDRAMVLLLVLGFVGCRREEAQGERAPVESVGEMGRLKLGGAREGGLATIAVAPSRLEGLVSRVTERPGSGDATRETLDGRTFVAGVLAGLFAPKGERVTLDLGAADSAGPWVFDLFIPTGATGPGWGALAGAPGSPPPFWHHAEIPSKDVPALERALVAFMEACRGERLENGGWSLPSGHDVHLRPQENKVRVAVAPRVGSGRWTPPEAPAGSAIDALALMTAEEHAITASLRGQHLGFVATAAGLLEAADALGGGLIPKEELAAVEARILADALDFERAISLSPPELVDHLVGLRAEAGGLRLRGIARVGPALREALPAAKARRFRPPTFKKGEAALEAGWSLDPRPLIEAAPLTPVWQKAAATDYGLPHLMSRCGPACYAHLALRAPLAFGRLFLARNLNDMGLPAALPRGGALGVDLDATGSAGILLALAFNPGDATLDKAGFEERFGETASIEERRTADEQLFGFRLGPARPTAWNLDDRADAPGVLWVRATASSVSRLTGLPADTTSPFGTLDWRAELVGDRLIGTLIVPRAGETIGAAPPLAIDAADTAPSEGLAREAVECLDRALEAVGRIASAAAHADRAEGAQAIDTLLAAGIEGTTCLASHPAHGDLAKPLLTRALGLLHDARKARGDDVSAVALHLCASGSKSHCDGAP